MSFRAVALLCLIYAAFPTSLQAQTDPVDRAINNYILPNAERFVGLAELLSADVSALCEMPGQESLRTAKASFRSALLGYMRIDILRIGPMNTGNLRERFLFWPDRRSTGLKQVQRLIAKADGSATDPATLSEKSVAVQGFLALEFLLFGTGSDVLYSSPSGYRCKYASAAARNIANMAGTFRAAWQSQTGFQKSWREPGPNNDLFQNDNEALGELFGVTANAFEAIRDQRLLPIAPKGEKTRPPKRAFMWRSNMTQPTLKASFAALQDFINHSGMLQNLPKDQAWIQDSVALEFKNANAAANRLDGPILTLVSEPTSASQLSYLVVLMSALNTLIGEDATTALNLPRTFSPLDGD
ncbi:MAG: imelysin family protein [Pseudomonadota bacterium]